MGFGRWPLRIVRGAYTLTPQTFAVDLSGTSSGAYFNIRWINTETPDTYSIYYKTNASATYTSITNISSTELSYTIPSLTNDISYNIYMTATKDARESIPTTIITKRFYEYPVKPTYTFSYQDIGYTVKWVYATTPPSTQINTLYYTRYVFNVLGGENTTTLPLTTNGSKNLTSLLVTPANNKEYACYVMLNNGSLTRVENIGPTSGATGYPFADNGNNKIKIYEKPTNTNVTLSSTVTTNRVSITVTLPDNTTVFTAGTSLNTGINSIKYKVYNNTSPQNLIRDASSSPITITGLSEGTQYIYNVSVVNNFGVESDQKSITSRTLRTMNIPSVNTDASPASYLLVSNNNNGSSSIKIYTSTNQNGPFTSVTYTAQIYGNPPLGTGTYYNRTYYKIPKTSVTGTNPSNTTYYFKAAFYSSDTNQTGTQSTSIGYS